MWTKMTEIEVIEESNANPDTWIFWSGWHADWFGRERAAWKAMAAYVARGNDAYGDPVTAERAGIWHRGKKVV